MLTPTELSLTELDQGPLTVLVIAGLTPHGIGRHRECR